MKWLIKFRNKYQALSLWIRTLIELPIAMGDIIWGIYMYFHRLRTWETVMALLLIFAGILLLSGYLANIWDNFEEIGAKKGEK